MQRAGRGWLWRDGTPVPSASGQHSTLPFVEADGIGMPSLQPSGNFLTTSETLGGLLSLPFALLEGELAVLGGCHAGDALMHYASFCDKKMP